MAVILTQEVEGQLVGSTYTGPDEAYLLASGYARKAGYTGPGVSNTGPADCSVAEERVYSPRAHQIAANSGLPKTSENGGITLKTASAPTIGYTGPEA